MTLEKTYLTAKYLRDSGEITQEIFRDIMDCEIVAVVHAHWIETEDLAGNHYIECSRCHWDFWLEGETAKQAELLHCPRCGAMMDEIEEK